MGVSSCSLTHDRMTRRSLHRSYGVAFSRRVRELFVPRRCSSRIRLVSLGLNKRSDRNLACWRYFRDWERTRSFHFFVEAYPYVTQVLRRTRLAWMWPPSPRPVD